jgi:GNAT superfamily N-acetyltransferase
MALSRTERGSYGSVTELVTASEIQAAQRLRYTVWQSEGVAIQSSDESIADGHDEHATHWGVYDGNRLVASARLCLHDTLTEVPDARMFIGTAIPSPAASMNRLVVLKSHRGQGIARPLDEARIEKAGELGARTVIITPINVSSRKQSLGNLGFQVLTGVAGHPSWSQSVEICACYLILDGKEAEEKRVTYEL